MLGITFGDRKKAFEYEAMQIAQILVLSVIDGNCDLSHRTRLQRKALVAEVKRQLRVLKYIKRYAFDVIYESDFSIVIKTQFATVHRLQ